MPSTIIASAIPGQGNARSQSYWSSAIRESWQKSTESIFETGRRLLQAREELDRDVFNAMRLPFGMRTKQMLIRIAEHPIFANHGSQLPPCWRTLYELTKLNDNVLRGLLEDGTINPGMQRKDVSALLDRPNRKTTTPKPELLRTWAAATEIEKHMLFDRIGGSELLGLISPATRAELIDQLDGQRVASSSSSSSLAVNLTRLLRVALSSNNINERDSALASVNRKLKANGRDLHDIGIAIIGANQHKHKKAA
jgi:hypothetical protein